MEKLLLWVCLFFFAGCSTSQKEQRGKVIKIDLEKDLITRDDLIALRDSVKIIPLKSSEIVSVSKVTYKNGRYYVLSQSINQSMIYIFDTDGNLLFKIDKTGRAKGEYSMLMGVIPLDDVIRTWDMNSKIIDYSLEDGSFVAENSLESHFDNFISNGDITVLGGADKGQKMVSVYDASMNKLYDGVDKFWGKDGKRTFTVNVPFFMKQKEIYYTNRLSNEIYSIEKDSAFVKYTLDFGKANMTEDMYDKLMGDTDFSVIKTLKCVIYVDLFQFTDCYLNFIIVYEGGTYGIYYNKETNKANVLYLNSIEGGDRAMDTYMYYSSVSYATDDDGFFIGFINNSNFTDGVLDKFRENDPFLANKITEVMQSNNNEYEYYLLLQKYK